MKTLAPSSISCLVPRCSFRLSWLAIAMALLFPASILKANERPNFIIVFMDDLGYGDVGCFGGDPELTPHLDRMAAGGLKMTDFYVPQPVCSPSRAGILTGVNPSRLSIFHVFFPKADRGLNPNEPTVASRLQKLGYSTKMLGKWHLGDGDYFNPMNFGFDEFYGIPYSNDMWPHGDAPEGFFPPLPLFDGFEVLDPDIKPEYQERMTVDLTEKAVDYIRRERPDKAPFFLYLAHPMPHRPLFVSERFAGKSGKGLYADVLMEIDWSVGEILSALEETAQTENTCVVFTSDNGPWLRFGNRGGSPGKLSKGKLTTFEGGIRVPGIVHWPAMIEAGSVTSEPLSTLDLTPTFLEAAGATLTEDEVDGKSLLEMFQNPETTPTPHDILPFYYQENELQAARMGPWKLIFRHHLVEPVPGEIGMDGPAGPQHTVVQPMSLFDMKTDPGETENLLESHPDIVAEMQKRLGAIRLDLGDTIEGYPGEGRRTVGVRP